jgi:hypothetical protein
MSYTETIISLDGKYEVVLEIETRFDEPGDIHIEAIEVTPLNPNMAELAEFVI